MHEHITLLIRLGQIAGEPCSTEERASHALALLNAYTARLYSRVGIGSSNKIATGAKSLADQTLADLRREILAAEVHAADSCRRIFTAVRHRIEMARRVLASRITDENLSAPSAPHQPEGPSYALTARSMHDHAHFHRPCRRARLGSLSGQFTM